MINPHKEIHSGKLFIKNAFGSLDQNEMWYSIPSYQRPYVWENDQVLALLEDVRTSMLSAPDSEYFLGSIVMHSKISQDKNYEEHELLDGQQRLTTIYLLLSVFRDKATDKDMIDTCNEAIFQKGNAYKQVPERPRIIFNIRPEVQQFTDTFVKAYQGTNKRGELEHENKSSQDISIKNMAGAILTIQSWFDANPAINISDLFTHLLNNVLLIFVASYELDDAFRLFTVLNDRGVKLRSSDILKAENLKLVTDIVKQKRFAEFWEEIEGELGESFDEFLSHIRTVLVKEKARLSLLKEFEQNIYNPRHYDKTTKTYTNKKPLLKKGEETFEYILKFKKHYDRIFNSTAPLNPTNYAFENLIAVLNDNSIADIWIPPLMAYREYFGDKGIFEFLIKLDNKFSADLIIGETPTTRIENMAGIISAIEEVYKSTTLKDKEGEVLKCSNLVFDVNDFKKEISTGEIYRRKYARYLLLKLDYLLSSNNQQWNTPAKISIEHILPQNPDKSSQWSKDYNNTEIMEWKHRLGNLVLIERSKNSSLGNLDYAEKKKKYFSKNINVFPNSLKVLQAATWRLTDLTQNHKNVTNLLVNYYSK